MQNWDCKVKSDIVYEVKSLIYCIVSKCIGAEFCRVPVFVAFTGIKNRKKLNKQRAMKNMFEISYNNLCTIISWDFLRSWKSYNYTKISTKRNMRYFLPPCTLISRVRYKIRLDSRNIKYSQNVTGICTNPVSVNYILFQCPVTIELFRKDGYDFTAYDNVRDILCNTDAYNFYC